MSDPRATTEALFPAQSSVLDESALRDRIVSTYEIGPVESCRFLERGDADIYRVETGGADYYLKVSRPPRTAAEAESEARFVSRLAESGVPVVRAARRPDATYASQVLASEGLRPILLFEEAPPPLPKEITAKRMAALGRTVARVHEVADAEDKSYDLPTFDLETAVAERVPHIRRFANEEDQRFMEPVVEWIRSRLVEIPREPPDWGICHADLVLSNVRAGPESDSVTLFDFGSLSRTYRGYDLAVVFWSLGHRDPARHAERWTALLDGYASIRSLPDRLEEHLPAFLALRELAFLGGNAATIPLRLGTEPFESSFMHDGFDRIRSILAEAGAIP